MRYSCLICQRRETIKALMDGIEEMDELCEYFDSDINLALLHLDNAYSVHDHERGPNCNPRARLHGDEERGRMDLRWRRCPKCGAVIVIDWRSIPYPETMELCFGCEYVRVTTGAI